MGTQSLDGCGRLYVPADIRKEVDRDTEFRPELVDGEIRFVPDEEGVSGER